MPANRTSPRPSTSWPLPEAACRDPRSHKYTPTAGLPELREAVAAKTRRDSGLHVAAQQILITNGAKQAIANSFAVLCDPGDEVLVLAPYWTTYPEAIALAGGVPVVIPTDASSGFRVSVDRLEAALTARTKVLLFVSPSNPTGAVYPKAEIETIGRWAGAHGLWVLTDEIYEHLVYGDAEHHSMPVLVPELADRCIVVNGVAKTYAMTGWRVGWMIGPTDVVVAATNLQSHETSNVANVSQWAALAAVSGDLSAVAEMRRAFDRRRLTIHAMLNEIDGITCVLPEGAFYAFPSVEGLLGREIRGHRPESSTELAEIGHRRGEGGGGGWRGVRVAWLLPDVVCHGRRRPGRRRLPPGQAVRRRVVRAGGAAGAARRPGGHRAAGPLPADHRFLTTDRKEPHG